ncbi:MAG: C45 family peptidase [Halopseudomonas sp.]
MNSLHFEVIKEDYPADKFSRLFQQNWPAYQAWYLDEGEAKRPTYLDCIQALKQHMPELYPLYKDILKLLDCDDLQARFLSLYCPPPFYSGCSQLIVKNNQPALIRNYDFPPILCEGTILHSKWLGKSVIAMADCIWGALDGMNESGLAVSIAYGGRLVEGPGFGITIVMRYVLETCSNVEEAIATFRRIPVHLDYNIALLDSSGQHATVFIAPDRKICVTRATTSTNHQGTSEDEKSLFLADSMIRLDALNALVSPAAPIEQNPVLRFLYPPLYRPHHEYNSGTLYTAAYYPREGKINYLWPHTSLNLSFSDSSETKLHIHYE